MNIQKSLDDLSEMITSMRANMERETRYYQNVYTGIIDTAESWKEQGFPPSDCKCLVEVEWSGSGWVAKC